MREDQILRYSRVVYVLAASLISDEAGLEHEALEPGEGEELNGALHVQATGSAFLVGLAGHSHVAGQLHALHAYPGLVGVGQQLHDGVGGRHHRGGEAHLVRSSCCHALLLEGGLHTGKGMDLLLVQLAVHSKLLDLQEAEISRVSNWSDFQVGGELG